MHFHTILLTLGVGCTAFYFCLHVSTLWSFHKKWIKHFWEEKQTQKELAHILPSLLLELGSFLQAGYALPSALKKISQTKHGNLFYKELKAPSKNTPFSFLHTSFLLSLKNGISLSSLLKHFSELIQTQIQMKEKIKILSFPIRAQAYVAMLLPWLTLFIFAMITPKLISEAFSSPWGMVGFSTAFVLEVLAFLWIQRILL